MTLSARLGHHQVRAQKTKDFIMDRFFDIAASIVTVALITVIVSSSKTADVIRAIAGAFIDSLKAAMTPLR